MTIWAAIVGYLLIQLLIGVWAARRVQGENDYLLAGRSLGPFMVAISVFATWFGAETVMGSAAAIAEKGLSGGRADPFGYAICLLAMALFIAYRMRAAGYVTLGDFFRARYGKEAEVLAVVILVPASVIWAAAQLLAFGQILVVVSSINIDIALIVAGGLVILYTVLGGLLGDVVTDIFQGAVLVIGLVVLLFLAVSAAGGWEAALAKIEPKQLSLIDPMEGPFARLDAWMIPIIGSLVSQEAISRFLAARDAATAKRACYAAAGVYLAVGMVPVLIALFGAHMDLGIGHRDEFLPLMAQKLLPTLLFVVFVGALLSAILSTVDSTILSVSSLVSHNLLARLPRFATDRARLRAARVTVVIAGVCAYLVARSGDTIYGLVQTASSFGTAGISVAVLFGLWSRFGGQVAALSSLTAGIAATVGFQTLWEIEAPFITSVALALVVFVAVAAFERRQPAIAG